MKILDGELTIVITAHHARYLTEALLSVASQTSKLFNLVCCADVSYGLEAYKCFEEILPYIQCQKKLLLAIEGNGTAGFVRNIAFNNAETEWIGYLDGDDLLHIDTVNYIKGILQDPYYSDIDIFSSGMVRIHTDGQLEPISDSLNYLPPLTIYENDPDTLKEPTYFNQFQIIRKNAWRAYKYDETTNGEDIDFMLHHLLMRHFKKIPKYLYYYRYTPNSFSSLSFTKGDICTQRYANGYYIRLFKEEFSSIFINNFKKN
ncbi:MAG: glycosyltransferase [Cuspidothrix sp.]